MATNDSNKLRRHYIRAFGLRWTALQQWERVKCIAGYPLTLVPSSGKTINTYLPVELLREIFFYSIGSNQIKSVDLASVCRHWRSVITRKSYLWSTLRVGTWTERERVTTWLHRALPKKIFIDTQLDDQGSSSTPSFAALQDALAATNQWNELTISSFPSENMASHLSFQVAMPMDALRILHVGFGCVHSPSFTHLLDLVPTEGETLLSELRLHSPFASAHFLQPRWLPVYQNLTVLIVNCRNIHEPFDFLPVCTRLHTFEADRLPIPWYELDNRLPLLYTLHKLQLRASSVQWMAGRQFPFLEECAILLPRHWEAIQEHKVQLPSCRKFIYHGYPMTTAQYFHVPRMRDMELRSHDCKKRRVHQQLRILCTVDGWISKLTTLHVTLQCSEQALTKVLRYLGPLQELVLSIAHPPLSWKHFVESLAAKPVRDDWPNWKDSNQKWKSWCFSQTWRVDVLPHLKYLGIQCPKGFFQSKYFTGSILLRLAGWSRAHLIPPLEHLKVWEGRGAKDDMMVDYISNGYLHMDHMDSNDSNDTAIIRGMMTQSLFLAYGVDGIFPDHYIDLFGQLQDLVVDWKIWNVLRSLKQIKRLRIQSSPENPLGINFPSIHTLQWLELADSPFYWMLGMTFKTLREFHLYSGGYTLARLDKADEALQVDLPACTLLVLRGLSTDLLHYFSSPNVQVLRWGPDPKEPPIDQAALRSLRDFLCHAPRLQKLEIRIDLYSEPDLLFQFLFCDLREEGVWRDIRSVEVAAKTVEVEAKIVEVDAETPEVEAETVEVEAETPEPDEAEVFSIVGHRIFSEIVGHQRHYDKLWKVFTVTRSDDTITVRASM